MKSRPDKSTEREGAEEGAVATPANISARTSIEAALSAAPDDAELNFRMGMIHLAEGEVVASLDYFHLALHYAPDLFPACAALANAYAKLRRPLEEAEAYRVFLRANPGHSDAAFALAVWHHARGEFEAALTLLRPLAGRRPVLREACNLLGLILGRELGHFDEGERLLRLALEPDPSWPVALSNLGWILLEKGDYSQGMKIVDSVLERFPDDHDTRLVRSYMNLKHGRFEEGWRDFEARHHSRFAASKPIHFEQWDGMPMRDKSLFISGEQGLGDQIMFASCFEQAIARTGPCTISCNPKLAGLFRRSFPGASVYPDAGEDGGSHEGGSARIVDREIPMGSLPRIFRNRRDDFPRHSGYLRADPARIAYWRSRLDKLGPGLKVGLSWRGGIASTRRHLRSVTLEEFLPLMRLPAGFVSLQYGDCTADLSAIKQQGVDLPHWQEALDDYDETAALVCALDLVISVCTAVIHLAGALGRPVWVLVPSVAEWRYLDRGETLPWYPSARLFRQSGPSQWQETLARLGVELAQFHETPAQGLK
ncbi:MAG: hypothetical protein IH604_13960 [Burkholderiales bacterium]|nr:hypothetical protein [Burkholderiales bacterium]